MFRRLTKFLIGKALPTNALKHERLSNPQGLAIFASDPLSSTAYATEEILLVLVLAGSSFLGYSLPIALAITALIVITVISYRQLIHSHPEGGGAYQITKKHFGEFAALTAAASLIFDYILTAAVSVSAGVAAVTSAFPSLFDHRVLLALGIIVFLTIMNLRGVRESGRAFTAPTYLFIFSLFALIIVGMFRYFTGEIHPQPVALVPASGLGILGIFLLIRAFAAGCTAITGIEATANGVQSLREPASKNASIILFRMAVILAFIFIGITVLATILHIVPKPDETVVSQIARAVFGPGPLYYILQTATALILLLAANTPFAALPRLSSMLAKDRYMPRQFFTLGGRLVYKNGILFLAILSGGLVILFQANTHALIPLYAVGVFIGFTLAQWSMVKHWEEQIRGQSLRGYKIKRVINMVGAATTGIVLVVVFISKFTHGAWVVLPALFFLIVLMRLIKAHYQSVADQLSLVKNPPQKFPPDRTVLVLISGVHQGTLKGLEAAKNLKPAHLRAVHIAIDPKEARDVEMLWQEYGEGVPIDIVPSPERNIIEPLAKYVAGVERRWKNDSILLVIPEFVSLKPWEHLLHSQTALQIRWALSHIHDVEILDVPYRLRARKSLNIMLHIVATLRDIAHALRKPFSRAKRP